MGGAISRLGGHQLEEWRGEKAQRIITQLRQSFGRKRVAYANACLAHTKPIGCHSERSEESLSRPGRAEFITQAVIAPF